MTRQSRLGRSTAAIAAIVAVLATVAAASLVGGGSARGVAGSTGQRQTLAARVDAAIAKLPAGVTVARDPRSGVVRFVGAPAGHPLARPSTVAPDAGPTAVAAAFLRGHAALFGLEAPATELTAGRSVSGPGGRSVVRFTQRIHGVPVLGGQLTVALTHDGRVLFANGETLAEDGASVSPLATARLSAAKATRIATVATSEAEGVPAGRLAAGPASLAVFDPALLGVPTTAPTALVYRVEVTGDAPTGVPIDELVLVDAAVGAVALHVNQAEGVSPMVCDAEYSTAVFIDTCPPTDYQHSPGVVPDPWSSTEPEIQQAYGNSLTAIQFYGQVARLDDRIGVPDGPGWSVNSVVRICALPHGEEGECADWPYTYWTGHEMLFGKGFAAADDVIAHEITHSVVRNTAVLFPQNQSGAIDESMADVMGELVDQWDGTGEDGEAYRWMIGEDLPAIGGVLRDLADPTTPPTGVPTPRFERQPDRMTSTLDGSEPHYSSGVGDKTAYLIVDGDTFNGVTVPGLGGADPATRDAAIDKAAKIYMLTLTSLTSGADYADLARVLPASCDALVGVADIAADDCATVRAAVLATEMATPRPGVPVPDAPFCDDRVASTYWYDDMEHPLENRWTLAPRDAFTPWRYLNRRVAGWGNATSGDTSLWAPDAEGLRQEQDGTFIPLDGTATMTDPITVPLGKPSYLRFNHALDFDSSGLWYRDGGRVGYSTDGVHWHSAEPLFDSGGYNADIRQRAPRIGVPGLRFRGFSGNSGGYISARLNLSSLAGQQVRFRFHTTMDTVVGGYGWFVDDVRFYGCGPRPSAPTNVRAVGGVRSEFVYWWAPSDPGTSPLQPARVTVRSPDGVVARTTVPAEDQGTTITGLPSGVKLTTYVSYVNASGRGPAGRSNTLVATRLSLGPARQVGRAGELVTLRGRLTDAGTTRGLANRRVELYRGDPGADAATYTHVAFQRTAADGSYAFRRRPSSSSVFQVRFERGVARMGAASRKALVQVR